MREEVQGKLLGRRERDAVVEVLRETPLRVSPSWVGTRQRTEEGTYAEEEQVARLEQAPLPALLVLKHEPLADLLPVRVARLTLSLVRCQVRADERPLARAFLLRERDPHADRALVAHEADYPAPDRRDGDALDPFGGAASARVDQEGDAPDRFARDEAVTLALGRGGLALARA